MSCEICTRSTHEWYDCPKKPDGYVPLARRGSTTNVAVAQIVAGHSLHGSATGKGLLADLPSAKLATPVYVGSNPASSAKSDRSLDRHRPGYYADYQRKRRAAPKEKPNG